MAKKKNQQESMQITWIKSHKILAAILFLAFLSLLAFSYNKFLDWKNVQDLKGWLSEMQSLEASAEKITGKDFFIETSCESVGKFATGYSCNIRLPIVENQGEIPEQYVSLAKELVRKHHVCEILSNGRDNYRNALRCTLAVRNSNSGAAEKIFYDYDTSPGYPF